MRGLYSSPQSVSRKLPSRWSSEGGKRETRPLSVELHRMNYQLNNFIPAPVARDFNAPISQHPSFPQSLLFAVKRPISAAVSRWGGGDRRRYEGMPNKVLKTFVLQVLVQPGSESITKHCLLGCESLTLIVATKVSAAL